MSDAFNIYSNPLHQDGTRSKNYMCGYCESFTEYLLALEVGFNSEGHRIVICKTCLDRGIDAINQAYLGRKRK